MDSQLLKYVPHCDRSTCCGRHDAATDAWDQVSWILGKTDTVKADGAEELKRGHRPLS